MQVKPDYEQMVRINTIMDNFDFEKVHRTMLALDWTWGSEVPLLSEIKITARRLLEEIIISQASCIATGGFYAQKSKEDGLLTLSFRIDTFEEGDW